MLISPRKRGAERTRIKTSKSLEPCASKLSTNRMATGMAINDPPSNLRVATQGAGCPENMWESRTGSTIIIMSAECSPDRIHIPIALRKTQELRAADLSPTSQSRWRLNCGNRCTPHDPFPIEWEAWSIAVNASDSLSKLSISALATVSVCPISRRSSFGLQPSSARRHEVGDR